MNLPPSPCLIKSSQIKCLWLSERLHLEGIENMCSCICWARNQPFDNLKQYIMSNNIMHYLLIPDLDFLIDFITDIDERMNRQTIF